MLIQYGENPEYFKKDLVNVINYTKTEVAKPRIYTGKRELQISQLVTEVIVALFLSIILLFVMIIWNEKKVIL
jgi:hypothetical protein